jgi:hypothetical protein
MLINNIGPQAIALAGERRASSQLDKSQTDELDNLMTSQLENVYQRLVSNEGRGPFLTSSPGSKLSPWGEFSPL